MAQVSILFIVDECKPQRQMRQILRGHDIRVLDLGTKDPAVLAQAEGDGAVIVTSDKWIYSQLRTLPYFDKGRFKQAGVVRIPGTWSQAGPLLRRWLPVIEAVHQVTRGQADQRVVIEIRENGAVYIDP